jgi:hypothetical protein
MRSFLIRDPNRIISAAVLSSPRVNEQEIEAFARMANVSEEVLRLIGRTRAWTRHYSIVTALVRNAKTPVAVSLTLLPRLGERDIRSLSLDRNVPDPLRMAARRKVVHGE